MARYLFFKGTCYFNCQVSCLFIHFKLLTFWDLETGRLNLWNIWACLNSFIYHAHNFALDWAESHSDHSCCWTQIFSSWRWVREKSGTTTKSLCCLDHWATSYGGVISSAMALFLLNSFPTGSSTAWWWYTGWILVWHSSNSASVVGLNPDNDLHFSPL